MSIHKIKNYIYQESNFLGQGQFGTVYRGWVDETNQQVAIKLVQKQKLLTPKHKELFKQEISVMKLLQSENIVQLLDYIETANNCYLILEYCNNGDLEKSIEKKHYYNESDAIIHFKQILNGFKCMHEKSVMHRDFKAGNVFIKDDVFKIGDFGFAKQVEENNMAVTVLGTPYYMAPEILHKEKYNYKTDIWAIGVVFYQMLFGSLPFPGNTQIQLYNNQKENKIDFNKNYITISEKTQNLIKQMLVFNPKDRISWYDLFNHPALNLKQIEEKNDGEYEILSAQNQAPHIVINKDIDLKQQANFYNHPIFESEKEVNFEELLYDFKTESQFEEQKIDEITCTTLEEVLQEEKQEQLKQKQKIIDESNKLNQKYNHIKNTINQIGFIIEMMYQEQQQQPQIISVLWTIYIQKLEYLNQSLIGHINIFKSEYTQYFLGSEQGKKLIENISLEFINQNVIFDMVLEEQQQANFKKKFFLPQTQKEIILNYIFQLFGEISQLKSEKSPIIKKLKLIYYLEDLLLMDNVYQYNYINPVTKQQSEFNFEKYNQTVSSTTIEECYAKVEGRLDQIMNEK